MRVLILHSRYLSGDVSGENRVVEDEARLLSEAGHGVRVWAPSPDVSGALAAVRAGASAVWSARAAREVGSVVRRNRVEVVHVHNLFPMLSPAVLRAAKASGAAVVVSLHNYRLMCLPANLLRDGRICEECVGRLPWRGVAYRCYRGSALGSAALFSSVSAHRGIGSFDAVTSFLAVSEFVRRKHLEAGIVHPDRVRVKPNFTWPAGRREGPGGAFVYVGRLAPEKGVDTLLRAWGRGTPPARLIVVGDGPEEARLRAAAPEGVEFRGRVGSEEVAGVVAGARALLVPSRWYEAAGKTVLEAYAAGVPVIASDIGALPEAVVDGVSGFLVSPEDPPSWAEAATRLLDDAESERLGDGARRLWAERYSPERAVEALEEAYRDALADRAEGGW